MRDPVDPKDVPPVDRPPEQPVGLLQRLGGIGLILAVAAIAIVVAPILMLAGSYLLGDLLNPACTDDEREVWGSIEHYGDLRPEAVQGIAGCVAQFEPDRSPERILNHYRSVLRADGWLLTVESENQGTIRPMPSGTPPPLEEMPYDFHSVTLERDGYTATVSWDVMWREASPAAGAAEWEPVTTVMVNIYRN